MFGILIWTAIIGCVYYLWDVYSYWRRRGVCGPIPLPLIGNYGPVIFQTMNELELTHKLYERYPNEKVVGIYKGLQPVLLVRDVELFKYFLIKDDKYFYRPTGDRPRNLVKFDIIRIQSAVPPLLKQPLEGILYKRQIYDKVISHLQSTALKNYLNRADELVKKKTKFNVEILQYKFMVEAISAVISGIEINTFEKESDYENAVSCIVNSMFGKSKKRTLFAIYPSLFSIYTKFAYSFTAYDKLASFIKKKISDSNSNGEDPTTIVEHLLKLRGKHFTSPVTGNIVDIDDKYIVQFVITLSCAGIEPVTRILSFMFYELAMNQAIQNKVYEEVSEVLMKHNGKLSMNALCDMKFSEMVIRETIRLYSSENYLQRMSVGRYIIPGTKVNIDEQTTVYLLRNCHKIDPQFFPNPKVFDPDRFSPTNKLKIPRMAFVPFGAGVNICVGRQIADVIILSAMATLLQKYRVVHCDLTPQKSQEKVYSGIDRNLQGDIILRMEPRNAFV